MSDNYYPAKASASKSRISRRCCECGNRIWRGEIYELYSGFYDGAWDTWHTCADCWEQRQELFEMQGHNEFTFCSLAEEFDYQIPIERGPHLRLVQ